MSDCEDCDEILILNPIPGPAGDEGDPGADSTIPGPAGIDAFTLLSSPFTQPAVNATVNASVANTAWMAVGQALFIEVGGYYSVVSILSPVSVQIRRENIAGFAATSAAVPSGSKVSPAGFAYVDNSQYTALLARVVALETAVPSAGITTYYQTTPPTGSIATGSLWFDTDDGYKMYRWDGSGWVPVTAEVTVPDFGTGLRPISLVTALPVGDPDDLKIIFNTTDHKLYRYNGSTWTAAIQGTDILGTIDGTQLAANTVLAGAIAAGAILASAVGANQIITVAANIGAAVINDAHVADLSASKITAGIISGQIIQIAGAGGALRSSNYAAGSAGFNISGLGVAEFNSVTIRGTLEASKIRTDSAVYNAGSVANTMASITWQNGQVDNAGAGYASLGVGGTVVWILNFYGWTHGAGTFTNRFGKATTQFDCSVNAGSTVATSSYCDLEIVYRVNGGTIYQVNPFAVRSTDNNGSLNCTGGVSISGLGGGDLVEFGVRAKSANSATRLNVANLTVKAFNF